MDQFRPPTRIGFVGLGQMGLPMARNLASAGYQLVLHDASPAALARARDETGGEVARDAFADCPAVITMLPDGSAVRAVLLDARLAAGTVAIDMSSSSPIGTRELGVRLAERGIALVDAPVSGGARKAADATLSIMAGGDPQTIARCRPLLESMGKQIFLVGLLGSGHAMKALNNYVSAAGLVAAIEAVLAGQRFGLEAKIIVDVLNASTGMNNSTKNKLHQYILSRRFDAGFSLGLMLKDLRTAMEIAHATGSPVPLGEACLELWTEARDELGAGADHTEIALYWEKLAEMELASSS
jgi:3-hydroxyisobutyrate dehydrogenase